MSAKKMKIEIFDHEGNRYTIAFKGNMTRRKALCLLDIAELLGGVQEGRESNIEDGLGKASRFDKTKFLVGRDFQINWFSSKQVLQAYEGEFKEGISLSTISTYLARLTDRGFLVKKGSTRNREYRMITKSMQSVLGSVSDR